MLERFHRDAREAVAHAKDEASQSGRREIGLEHLLLGLLARPGHASDALTAAGADAADLRAHLHGDDDQPEPPSAEPVAAASVAGDGVGDLPVTREVGHAFELALQAAHRLRHQRVSSGHLLLGVIDQPGSPAVQALTVAGIHVGMLRADVLQRLLAGAEPFPHDSADESALNS